MKNFLLLMILIAILTTTACKKNTDNKINAKQSSKTLAKSLDFSYFPADSTILGVIDFQSIFAVNSFKPMLIKAFAKIKKTSGLDVSKLKSLSAFINVKNIKDNPFSNAAVIFDGIDITKAKNFPKAIKTEKFEGLSINIYDDKTGFIVTNGKTIGGTLVSVKNAISLNKGKLKNLASTPRSNDFKNIISKLKGSQLSIAFVSNKNTDIEIKKYSNKPQLLMIKVFLDNIKSAGFGIKIDEKNIDFILVIKSSKEGAKSVEVLANSQLKQFTGSTLNAQLSMIKGIITQNGVNIIKNIIKTVQIKANKEFLIINFRLTVKDAMKIPEILMSLGLMPMNKNFTKSIK